MSVRKFAGEATIEGSWLEVSWDTPSSDEWFTPPEILEAVREVFGGTIDLDPASCAEAQRRVKADQRFTKFEDGLTQPWRGRVFLNPPYSRGRLGKFVDKLLAEIDAGHVIEAIMLVNSCTDTAWFRRAAGAATMVCFTEGRIKFIRPGGKRLGSPPQGQAVFYFGANPKKFKIRFLQIGLVGMLEAA